jgi:hypothetical protein
MTPETTPRVEIELKADRTCYLSNGHPFRLVVLLGPYLEVEQPVTFV